jgi:TetR/AcrR family transcriptional repressor of nem operon
MSVGRPCEFDPQHALDVAMRVFWQQGYDGTSLGDLLTAMDLSKSSLYQAFGGKAELFQRCLEHYRDTFSGRMRAALDQAPSGLAYIESILSGVAEGTAEPMGRAGCLLINTASEFGQRDPQIAQVVGRSLERFEDLFFAAICRAQAEKAIPKEANARSLSFFLVTSLGGLKGMARAGASPEKIRTVVQVIMNSLR